MVPAIILLVTGCGGISASRSVSPLDFFMPGGLLKADPKPVQPDLTVPNPEPVKQVAFAR